MKYYYRLRSNNIMKMKYSNYLAVLGLCCISCTGKQNKSITKENILKPNIIYILADDMGYGDLRSLNQDSRIPTPNMDKLVHEGIHFTDYHSGSAVSTPTRYGILTGRYAFRTRLKKGVLWGYSPSLIEPGRVTVASFLKENGYNTACIGKWHLGLDWVKKDQSAEIPDVQGNYEVPKDFQDNVDYSKPVKGGPQDHGFEYSFIIPASLDMSPYLYLFNGEVVEEPSDYTEGKDQNRDGRGVFWRCGKVSPSFDFDKVLPTFIDSACHYIKSFANIEKPFFLYLALPAPHTPWLPVNEYIGLSKAGRYGDFVAMVDDMIGKILKTLDDTDINENTLIIITSDNGSDWRPSDIEQFGHRANFIYRGRKADIYEGGHHEPFVARWKGVIPAGKISDEIMCSTDLFATLAGMLHRTMPDSFAEDSYDLWPAFIGKVNTPVRETIIHHSEQGYYSIRKGNWKFTPYLGSGGFTEPIIVIPKDGETPGTLYDLKKDIQEKNNLYNQYPEIVEELKLLLEKYKEQGYSRPMKVN